MGKTLTTAFCAALLIAGLPCVSPAAVTINEILASNSTGLQDGFGQREDWIEIHNDGAADVSLAGHYLTDEPDFPTKWQFPDTSIAAGGYLVVIASGKDLTDTLDYPHSSFRLGRNGDYLALVGTDGTTVLDAIDPAYPEQFTDVSYGRQTSDGALRFFSTPTPGADNGEGYLGVVKDTNFSIDRGFYDTPFSVVVTSSTSGANIRYTIDGTKPSETVGTVYGGPVAITNTTTLRAIAYQTGWLSTDVDTHTYIFIDQVARQPADPAGWPSDWGYDSEVNSGDGSGDGTVPADYEMDPQVVDNTLTNYSVRDALLDIPTVSIAMDPDDFIHDDTGIYANPKSRWERECSAEYIHPDGAKGFQLDCKIEVHGNSSRRPWRMQKHSLRLTFTTEFGPPQLRYALFEDSPVERFNQLVLRACFTDSWGLVSWGASRYRPNDSMYIRDVWMKDSLRDMGQPSSHGGFVHLYVNGLYFGLHNLTERLAPDFFADHVGGLPEDWEINEDLSSPGGRWNAMMAIDPSLLSGYEAIRAYLDVEDFADYMLLHFYADAEDWPHHNGYAAANATSHDGRFRFFVWDQEIVLDYHGRAASRIDNNSGAGKLFQKMRTSAEFRLLFADRFYRHCFNDGALSLPVSQSRFLRVANEIDKAIVAESARWGDTQVSTPYGNSVQQPSPLDDVNHHAYPPAPHGPDYTFTREDSWVLERDNVISNYLPAIHNANNSYALVNILRAENLYPDIDPPEFNRNGGEVPASFGLTMSAAAGTIHYTLDGTDPRNAGGTVNRWSETYTGAPVFFTHNPATVKARALHGTEWSALHEARFFVDTETARAGNLVVSEIHYNPKGSDSYEFIELLNTGPVRVALDGVQLAVAVEFMFGDLLLEPGEHIVVVEDSAAFSNRYLNAASPYHHAPIRVAGAWTGDLANGGESVRLLDRSGGIIQEFTYRDGGAWPGRADGRGASLQRARPEVPPQYPEHWRASCRHHGSPGRADDNPAVVINELMNHSDTGVDWIELWNSGSNEVDISGWFLSDELNDPFKYALPNRAPLVPGEYAVYDQHAFGTGTTAFSFSELGEEAALTEASGSNLLRVIAYKDFGASARDIPFGRHVRWDGTAAFTALNASSTGASNAYPLVGPVVIGEIMYHPAEGKPEYVELVNITPDSVPLYDPDHPTNTWKLTSAASFVFPPGTVVPAYGRTLVTETDPATFRAAYDVPPAVKVYGPWNGQLDNDGESVRLRRPGAPESDGTVPYIVMDRVDYRDYPPWPAEADGEGASLERLDYDAFGNDWRNWYASATSRGTPGDGPDPSSNDPNRYPVMTDPGTLQAEEDVEMSVQLHATDPDSGQSFRFRLQSTIPEGATVTEDGLLTWTPGEDDGPGTVDLEVVVTDDGIPNLSDTRTVAVNVSEVNSAPDLLRGSHNQSTNTVPFVHFGSVWRFLDDGSDRGTNWASVGYDDSGWARGPARLGYGDGNEATTVSYGPSASSKYRTTYFRHVFTAGIDSSGEDALWIDFGQDDTPVQTGYQAYTADHEQVASFTAQTFNAFGTLVTLDARWVEGAVNAAAQMYDRGTGYASDTPDLMRDWIGTDRRVTGNPLTLTLSGLPPGTYSWMSYHHDVQDQTGLFDVTLIDAAGSNTTVNVDISDRNVPLENVTTFETRVVADGSDVRLLFDKHPSGSIALSFFVMNAFQLARRVHDTSGTLSELTLKLVRDDGAVVYLTGTEVVRDNMPTGVIDYLTLATNGVSGTDETTPHLYALSVDRVSVGTNTLAVEVHQHSGTSSDLGFDLALEGTYVEGGPEGLVDYVVSAGETIRFVAHSTDPDRPAQGITYALGSGSPAGAAIDPRTGQFAWTPGMEDGPAVVTVAVVATDSGSPPLSDEESFTVTVIAPFKSGDVRIEDGRIVWNAIPGDTYRIEYCDDLTAPDWHLLEERTATNPTEALLDPGAGSALHRYYRVIWER